MLRGRKQGVTLQQALLFADSCRVLTLKLQVGGKQSRQAERML